jgi:hypothetical protein
MKVEDLHRYTNPGNFMARVKFIDEGSIASSNQVWLSTENRVVRLD